MTSDARVTVRPARPADLDAMTRIHRAALPDGFFARLGRRFLRTYHRTFQSSPQAVALVPELDGRVVGLIVGTVANRGHYRWVLRRRGLSMAATGLAALATHPRELGVFLRTRVPRYIRAIRRMASSDRDAGHVTDPRPQAPTAVLTHVAVAPAARGTGAGRELVDAFVRRCARAGAGEVRLVTPADGVATDFYRHLGWREVGTRQAADDTVVVEFRQPLQEPAHT